MARRRTASRELKCWLLIEEVDNEENDPNVSGQRDNVSKDQITNELATKFRSRPPWSRLCSSLRRHVELRRESLAEENPTGGGYFPYVTPREVQ